MKSVVQKLHTHQHVYLLCTVTVLYYTCYQKKKRKRFLVLCS